MAGRSGFRRKIVESGGNTPWSRLLIFLRKKRMPTKQLNLAGTRVIVRAVQISTCIVAVIYFNGCASSNYRKADAASDYLKTAGMKIDAENQSIDFAVRALDNLVNKPAPDLKPQFKHFSASLDQLVAASARAQKAAQEADKKSGEYFENWDKQTSEIKYEAVRDQSVSRKTQVSNEFNTVNERYRENQAVIEPLISYLQDIRTALSTDLTMGGVQSVKALADNAEQNARKVQGALAQLTDELSSSGERMSSVSGPEIQPKGGVSEATESHPRPSPGFPVNSPFNCPSAPWRRPQIATQRCIREVATVSQPTASNQDEFVSNQDKIRCLPPIRRLLRVGPSNA